MMMLIKRLRVHKLSLLNNNITTFERKILEIKSNLEEDKKWATSKESSSIIKLGLEPNSIIKCNNIHEYINSRGFFEDVLLKSSSLSSSSSLLSSSSPSFRFMTALLTFPLTLSYVLNNININNTKNINVLVLGARSESSLPFYWWKVMIIINIIILYY